METGVVLPATEAAALDDLASRFLWNLPRDEVPTVVGLFSRLRDAHFFYLDFYVRKRDGSGGLCPYLEFEVFVSRMFDACPLLAHLRERHAEFVAEFHDYLESAPTYGAVLLDRTATRVLLIKAWRGKCWGFPKGKVNEGEGEVAAAAREVWEEVGFNPGPLINPAHYITHTSGPQFMKLFVVVGVPDDGSVEFAPHARREVSEISWFDVAALPTSRHARGAHQFWNILPLLSQLHAWLARPAVAAVPGKGKGKAAKAAAGVVARRGGGGSTGGGGGGAGGVAGGAGGGDAAAAAGGDDVALEDSGATGWSVNDMFATNARLLGKVFVYDGNPHTFGDHRQRAVEASGRASSAPSRAAAAAAAPAPAARSATAVVASSRAARAAPAPSPPPPPAAGTGKKAGAAGKPKPKATAAVSTAAAAAAAPASGGGGPKPKGGAGTAARLPSATSSGAVASPAVLAAPPRPFKFDMDAILAAMALPLPAA